MHRRRQLVLHTITPLSDCLRRHEAIYRNVPGFNEQVAVFHRLATAAEFQTEQCLDEVPNLPADLRGLREALIQAVCAVAGPLAGWAAIIGDDSLRAQLGGTPKELRALGAALTEHARTIVAIGRSTLAQGAGHYGLTEIALERLLQEINRFEAALEVCPDAFQSLRSATEELHAFLRDVLDPLVRGFLLIAPGFCAAYRQARRGFDPIAARRVSASAPESDAVLHG